VNATTDGALLSAQNVTKVFGGLVAVEDVTFEVPERSIVSIIGPNGAGKTTFFNMLTGLYRPTYGRISFAGRNVTGRRPDLIMKDGMARTFQNIRLFATMTALENVARHLEGREVTKTVEAQHRLEKSLSFWGRPVLSDAEAATAATHLKDAKEFLETVPKIDVMTLLHEAGHAFHAFASHPLPLIWQRHPGSEAAELASMSMEFLAAPHLVEPVGYFNRSEAGSAWLEHLEDVLLSLVHIASVDAFQSWIYTSGQGGDAAARDEAWLRIRRRFERGVDRTRLEQERIARGYSHQHKFM
jgi:ABC-type dipeptide/oligopeptide/nickel transport system ATPase component